MPFRSKETLERWLVEFSPSRQVRHPARVVEQDGPDGTDTGLVVVPLADATTSIYVAPGGVGDPRWRVTVEPQLDETVLTSGQLHRLADELQVAAELCSYLEARSAEHLRRSPAVVADEPGEVTAPTVA